MQVIRFPDHPRPKWAAPVAALGNFDGVHRGHQKILERVCRQASERAGTPVVVTFDPHPPRIVRPDKAPQLLMTLDQKIEACAQAGIQHVAVVEFTEDMARWEPETFVDTVLVDWLRVAEVWVGANFLFGRERSGTYTLLKALGEDRGFRAENIDPVRFKDFVVSSTRIRRLVAEGRVDEAGALLGRHYMLEGKVVHGDARGRELGCPTANLATVNELLPAFGIYATVGIVDGVCHPAVTSVGVRPTIGDGKVLVETHLLDGPADLYGSTMRVAFVRWIREERAFSSLEALASAIAEDCEAARRIHKDLGL
jgi:riboflavin kinase / FMN adenylyltransferase